MNYLAPVWKLCFCTGQFIARHKKIEKQSFQTGTIEAVSKRQENYSRGLQSSAREIICARSSTITFHKSNSGGSNIGHKVDMERSPSLSVLFWIEGGGFLGHYLPNEYHSRYQFSAIVEIDVRVAQWSAALTLGEAPT